MKTKFKKAGLFIPVLLLVLFSSCYYDYAVTSDNYDIVSSSYNTGYNFQSVTKYYLVDTVNQFNGGGSSAYNSLIKSSTITNLNNLGWTKVLDSTQADVIVSMGTTSNTYVYSSGGYCYWGYYGYTYCDPNYYGYTSSYTTGTVVIIIADHKVKTGTTIPAQWIGILNGVMNQQNTATRIQNGINKAFSQSPYLKHN
jgi:hypothetical protein